MRMILPAEYDVMTWLGRGPQENYADRKTGYPIGLYTAYPKYLKMCVHLPDTMPARYLSLIHISTIGNTTVWKRQRIGVWQGRLTLTGVRGTDGLGERMFLQLQSCLLYTSLKMIFFCNLA